MQAERLNLRHVRAFVHVCKFGGISAAAGQIHLSQPAITQAIVKLETLLETQLFVRSSKGMVPTDAAISFLRRAERAFRILETGAQEVGRRQRVSIPPYFVDVITSTQLRALAAVATHGNFSVAARALGVSQPSIYRMARDIESQSQLRFYDKTRQGFELTDAAEIFLRAAKLAFAELDQGIEELRVMAGVDVSSLVIGSLPLARNTILPLAINLLTEEQPAVRIKVIDSPFAELLHGLRNGEIDMMIGALRDPLPAPDVIQNSLLEDRLGVFCDPGHPLLAKPGITLDDLAGYPWIIPLEGTPTRAYFDGLFARSETRFPKQIIETSSTVLVRGLLRGGQKLTIVSSTQFRKDVQQELFVHLPIELDDKPRKIGLTLRRDWTPTPTQTRFMELLQSVSLMAGSAYAAMPKMNNE